MPTLGQKLAMARIAQRLKQKEVAARSGITQKYLSTIEHDHVKPSFDLVVRLARALGVSLDSLAPDDEEEQPHAA